MLENLNFNKLVFTFAGTRTAISSSGYRKSRFLVAVLLENKNGVNRSEITAKSIQEKY